MFRRLITTALLIPTISCSTTPLEDAKVPDVPATQPITIAPKPTLPPLVLHLPGIGGARSLDIYMTRGLKTGGFAGDIQIFDWTGNDAGLKSLLGIKRNKLQSQLVADWLTARFDRDPMSRTVITCHSGGAGIAVWALEDLPERVKIDTLLMLAPALSPRYDLSRALAHVSGRMYVFSSTQDPVLGFGTRMLGTIDGVKTDAAGEIGFIKPPGADEAQYAKLTPLPYNPEWVHLHNHGDHVGAMTYTFARAVLAPLILDGTVPATQPTNTTAVNP